MIDLSFYLPFMLLMVLATAGLFAAVALVGIAIGTAFVKLAEGLHAVRVWVFR